MTLLAGAAPALEHKGLQGPWVRKGQWDLKDPLGHKGRLELRGQQDHKDLRETPALQELQGPPARQAPLGQLARQARRGQQDL